jgi:sulfite exporter TauE/SafE
MLVEITLLSAFLGGLMGGVHCVGMCGGIVTALSLNIQPDAQQAHNRRLAILLGYNAGRILSYTLAGILMGGVGLLSANLSGLHEIKLLMQLVAGVFMVLLGLYLAGWLMWLTRIENLGSLFWKRIEPIGRRLMPVSSAGQALLLGMVWGWLPCGLVYTALIWAVTSGGPLEGGLLMLSFGLGTLPVMLLMGSAASRLATTLQARLVRSLAGLLVIGFGLYLIFRVIRDSGSV